VALAVFGDTLLLEDPLAALASPSLATAQAGEVLAPMAGKLLESHVTVGTSVEAGQLLFVLESMKMQFEVTAPWAGRVTALPVVLGQVLQGQEVMAVLTN
jgi:propionyl-CoA carboxylase alpha chain